MRILLVNKFIFPKGGAETYTFDVGKMLEEHGHEVQYFGLENEKNIVGNRVGSYVTNMDFSQGIKANLNAPFRIIYSREARKKIRAVLDDFQPDVVHLNNIQYHLTPSIILEINKWRKETKKKCKIVYTTHDYQLVCPSHAIEAGFNHVVFIIRKDIEKEFKEVIGDRIASICSSHNVTVDYAFQDINDIPGTLPEGRTKPWGTGQAVLAAKKVLDTPFIVINADDYYGKEGFKAVHEYLVNGGKSCMAGFVLKNTLSDNGGVTRGVCKMDDQNNLTEVVETKNIVKTATGAETDGVAVDVDSLVSMNMWGLTPDFLTVLEDGFKDFFKEEVPGNPLKAEYLIPIFIGELLEQGKMSVKVLKTNDTWYGMTYHEDVAAVKDSFKKMLENGVYKADLFADL